MIAQTVKIILATIYEAVARLGCGLGGIPYEGQ